MIGIALLFSLHDSPRTLCIMAPDWELLETLAARSGFSTEITGKVSDDRHRVYGDVAITFEALNAEKQRVGVLYAIASALDPGENGVL